jgi:uncharacterized protein involved in outer membrane biogenesis
MALSKVAKIWIIVLAIPVVLVIIGIVAAKMYFTSDRLKTMVVPRVEAATHRSVAINDIGLSVFPRIGVTLDGVAISNPRGTEGVFDRNEFVHLENLTVNVKLLPLLFNKRLEILHVVLDRPVVYLEVSKDGRKNFTSTEKPKATPGAPAEQQQAGGEFLLSNFEIRGGRVEYTNRKFDSRMMINGLDQRASANAAAGENVFHVETDATVKGFSYGTLTSWYLSDQPVSAHALLSYRMTDDVLNFDSATVMLKELPLNVGGTISNLQRDTMQFNLTVTAPEVQMAQVLSLVPAEMLKAAHGISSTGGVQFKAEITGPSGELVDPATRATFRISNGRIQYEGLPQAITNVNVQGSFEKPSAPIAKPGIGRLTIERFTASLGGSDVNGRLAVTNFTDPTLAASFSGSLNLGEVRKYYPLEEGTDLSGSMRANFTIDGKTNIPQQLRANGQMEFQNVTIRSAGSPQPIRDLNGTLTLNNQAIESKKLTMNIGESDLNLGFTLRNYLAMVLSDSTSKQRSKPNATVTLTSQQLRTVDLTGDESSKSKEPADKGTRQPGGMLPGIDIDATVTIGKLVTEKFTFTNVRGSVNIADGIVRLNNFNVNAFEGSIGAKGMLDVRNPEKRPFDLDLTINGVESNALLPKFTSFGNNLFGKLSMHTSLKGDLNDTLGLNTKTLAGNGTVQLVEGKLQGSPLTSRLAGVTGISELRQVDFRQWTNSFSIDGGRMKISDLRVGAADADFALNGFHGLTDGALDYKLSVTLPAAVSNRIKLGGVGDQLLQFLKDKEGRLQLSFDVTGTMTDPTLHLDTKAQQDALQRAAEQKKQQLIDEGTKKAEDEAKKKLEEGLKKLFKKD